MRYMLNGKKILLGVTGGIAAYKAADIASRLVKAHAEVKVAMTKSACRFITPETLRVISDNRVFTDVFDEPEKGVSHIDLARWADAVLVAPATADFIAKAALGIADDMLTSALLAAWDKKIIIAPAMNCHMYENPVVRENLHKLIGRGFAVIEPEEGRLACGEEGVGRLPSPEKILERVILETAFEKTLSGKKVLVTSGATREAIDLVRYITNHSTGKMGFAIARAAAAKGADVTLVSGVTNLEKPVGVEFVEAVSAKDMFDNVTRRFEESDIVIKAAAVADFRPEEKAERKIKKNGAALEIKLERTDDILAFLGERKKNQILVGFCMETENLIENAKRKLLEKNLDFICANSLFEEGAGFAGDTNIITIVDKNGEEYLGLDTKEALAVRILEKCEKILRER